MTFELEWALRAYVRVRARDPQDDPMARLGAIAAAAAVSREGLLDLARTRLAERAGRLDDADRAALRALADAGFGLEADPRVELPDEADEVPPDYAALFQRLARAAGVGKRVRPRSARRRGGGARLTVVADGARLVFDLPDTGRMVAIPELVEAFHAVARHLGVGGRFREVPDPGLEGPLVWEWGPLASDRGS